MLVERTAGHGASSIVDVLDRVLDKGLSIAGDIRIAVAEVELLTIRIRLIICSIDKAREIGLDWWKDDRHFSPRSRNDVPDDLQKQIKDRSEEHTSELQSRLHLVCRLLLEKKKIMKIHVALIRPSPS